MVGVLSAFCFFLFVPFETITLHFNDPSSLNKEWSTQTKQLHLLLGLYFIHHAIWYDVVVFLYNINASFIIGFLFPLDQFKYQLNVWSYMCYLLLELYRIENMRTACQWFSLVCHCEQIIIILAVIDGPSMKYRSDFVVVVVSLGIAYF